jgi:hypothetical protein
MTQEATDTAPSKPGIHPVAQQLLGAIRSLQGVVQLSKKAIADCEGELARLGGEELREAVKSLLKVAMVLDQGGSPSASQQVINIGMTQVERLEAHNENIQQDQALTKKTAAKLTGRSTGTAQAPRVGKRPSAGTMRASSFNIPRKLS